MEKSVATRHCMPAFMKIRCERHTERTIKLALSLTEGSVLEVRFLGIVRLVLFLLDAICASWVGPARLRTVSHAY